MGNKEKNNKRKKLKHIFLRTTIITLMVVVLSIGALSMIYNHFFFNGEVGIKNETPLGNINRTLAIFGVDEDGYRTDVIIIANYNSKTGKIKLVSIPRDTKVEWSEKQQAIAQEAKGYSVSVSKLNEMTSYGGIENIRGLTINEIENLLDITVDNYVIVTIDAFKKLVDAVGGVDVVVPELDGNGLQYDDHYQNLHIHLDPGPTHLDGEKAEGFVRYRKGYKEGDVGRIKTQQIFLEAFAKKVTSPEIITKIPAIANVLFTSVTTDVSASEIPGYYAYFKKIDTSNLSFSIIPGEPAYQGGKAYYIPDMAQMPAFREEIFNDTSEGSGVVEDKTVCIEILNSTKVQGAAGVAKQKLEEDGYTVGKIDNYSSQLGTTIIYAKELSKATQFKKYYPNAQIQEKSDLLYDIQIILGTNDVK